MSAGMLMLFAGCPDYSHLRDAPDYENQTDGHGGAGAGESEQESGDSSLDR